MHWILGDSLMRQVPTVMEVARREGVRTLMRGASDSRQPNCYLSFVAVPATTYYCFCIPVNAMLGLLLVVDCLVLRCSGLGVRRDATLNLGLGLIVRS